MDPSSFLDKEMPIESIFGLSIIKFTILIYSLELSSRETIISLIFDSRFDLSVKNSLSAQKASLLLSVLNVPALILEKPQSKKV